VVVDVKSLYDSEVTVKSY